MGEKPTKEEKAKTIEANLAIELLDWFVEHYDFKESKKEIVMK